MSRFITKCPKCDGEFEAEAEWIGQEGECPSCGQTIPITCNAQTNASASSSPSNAPSCAAQAESSTKRVAKCPKCLREFDADGRLEWEGICPGCDRQTKMIIFEKKISPDTPAPPKRDQEKRVEREDRSSYIPSNKPNKPDGASAEFYKGVAVGGMLGIILAGIFVVILNAEVQKTPQAENASAPPTKTEPAVDEAKAKQHRMDVNGVTAFAEIQAISDQIKGKYHPDPTQALGKGTTYPTLTADEIDSIYIKAYRAKYYGK